MGIIYHSNESQDVAKTFHSVAAVGEFASKAQAFRAAKRYSVVAKLKDTIKQWPKGVAEKFNECSVAMYSGEIKFTDYINSHRDVRLIRREFIFDARGVVAILKAKYKYPKEGPAYIEEYNLEFEETSRQIEPISALVEEQEAARQAERDALEDIVEGRSVLNGTVISFKDVATEFGIAEKMLIKLDSGNMVYGTRPKSMQLEPDSHYLNKPITFTATLEKSNKDSKFGFFKRPSKIVIDTE